MIFGIADGALHDVPISILGILSASKAFGSSGSGGDVRVDVAPGPGQHKTTLTVTSLSSSMSATTSFSTSHPLLGFSSKLAHRASSELPPMFLCASVLKIDGVRGVVVGHVSDVGHSGRWRVAITVG